MNVTYDMSCHHTSVVLPFVVVGDLLDGPVVVLSVLGQEARVLLVGQQQTDPHGQVNKDEDIVQSWQKVPGYRNTLDREHSYK